MEIKNQPPASRSIGTEAVQDSGLNGVSKAQGDQVEKTANNGSAGYSVNLSEKARNLEKSRKKAFEAAMKVSPIREDRVKELKEKIAQGEYQADAGQIADGMLREAVKDRLAVEESTL